MKPADLQGFLYHVSGYNINWLSIATEDAIATSTPKIGLNAHVSQYELYKSHRTATSVWSKWLAHTTLMHPTMLNVFLVMMNWNKSSKINGGITFPLHRQNSSLESN